MRRMIGARELEEREASPTAGVIDSQSVKTTVSGGVCGCDAGKKIEGRKRHIVLERTFAWLDRCRRLARDWERSIESATAWTLIASIRMRTRRIARYCESPPGNPARFSARLAG